MTLWTKIKYLLSLAEKRETVSESIEARVLERIMEKVAKGHHNRDENVRRLSVELENVKFKMGL